MRPARAAMGFGEGHGEQLPYLPVLWEWCSRDRDPLWRRYWRLHFTLFFNQESASGASYASSAFFSWRCSSDGKSLRSTRTAWRIPSVSYTHLRAHETDSYLVCRLL